jgi:hypothetical protein
VLLDRGGKEAPELPQDDRQGEREAGHEADLHRGEKRLRNPEGNRIAAARGKGSVQPVQEMPVKDEGDCETDHERAERDEDARTELIEMLDERRLLTLAKAPRKTLHGLEAVAVMGRSARPVSSDGHTGKARAS